MQKQILRITLLISVIAINSINSHAGDWNQYRGPNFDGSSSEKFSINSWPESEIKPIWKTPTRLGFSSISVSNFRVFTIVMENIDGVEREA